MTTFILVFATACGILYLLFYLARLAIFEIIKVLAKKEKLAMFPKENRVNEFRSGDIFHHMFLSSKGESFFHEKSPNTIWKNEREKWEIVPNHEFDVRDNMTSFQQWVYDNTGAYWFQNLRNLKLQLSYREIDLWIYSTTEKKGVKIEPARSKYLFRTWFNYLITVKGAEDVTGNPLTIYIEVRARVRNPFIAWVENTRWDLILPSQVRDQTITIVNQYHFYTQLEPKEGRLVKYEKSKEEVDNHEIVDILGKTVLEYIRKEENDIGFEFSHVYVQDIIPERIDIADSIAQTFIAEQNLQQKRLEAQGEAAMEMEKGRANNLIRRENMEDMMKNLPAAQLLALEKSLGGATAISLGGDSANQIFMTDVTSGNGRSPEQTKKPHTQSKTPKEHAKIKVEPPPSSKKEE